MFESWEIDSSYAFLVISSASPCRLRCCYAAQSDREDRTKILFHCACLIRVGHRASVLQCFRYGSVILSLEQQLRRSSARVTVFHRSPPAMSFRTSLPTVVGLTFLTFRVAQSSFQSRLALTWSSVGKATSGAGLRVNSRSWHMTEGQRYTRFIVSVQDSARSAEGYHSLQATILPSDA